MQTLQPPWHPPDAIFRREFGKVGAPDEAARPDGE